ncbi:alpha/beta hydrolase [Salipiger abyssi]|uniref:Esterase/lipase superfamily enzyme n=1 Tax=Salipiger abyssi TaxID=1250539 RepID=A0A1P8URX7_9RHOB|nr:alpha/beta fold hydrolase [Salipiger abyssi]APZ52160.1 hypothetical protein Ga0080574_TMP1826 [Salipiger abyssi]
MTDGISILILVLLAAVVAVALIRRKPPRPKTDKPPKPPEAQAPKPSETGDDAEEMAPPPFEPEWEREETPPEDALSWERETAAPEPELAPPMPAPMPEMAAPVDNRYWVQRLFFGTDRNVERQEETGPVFGHRRANALKLGHTDITIPREAHRLGKVERPKEITLFKVTLWKQAEDPAKHFTVHKTEILSETAFTGMAAEAAQSAATYANTAFVFIHGFNTTFAEAMFRAAQLAHDLGFDGPAFAYSWPSVGETLDYVTDMDSADNAVTFIDRFLEIVFNVPGVEKVHLVAHSMGNAALAQLLTHAGTSLSQRGRAIEQLVLAAPDLDAGEFGNIHSHFTAAAKGVTLYACASDRALLAAQKIRGDYIRLGDVGPEGPMVVPGVDSIDVSAVGTDLFSLNHNVYAQDRGVLDDLGALFLTGQRPPRLRMPTLEEIAGQRGIYWRMPR